METYIKATYISELFPEKDVYAFGVLSIFLRAIFLFLCLVVLPVLLLISQLEFSAANINWAVELVLLVLIFLALTGVFLLIIKVQAHFYRKLVCQNLQKVSLLHLTSQDSLFSFQYALLFNFSIKKAVLCNHYKKVYVIKNFSDIHKWRIQQNSTSKKFNIFNKGFVNLYLEMKDQEKNYLFAFRLNKKQAQRWIELLGENASLI